MQLPITSPFELRSGNREKKVTTIRSRNIMPSMRTAALFCAKYMVKQLAAVRNCAIVIIHTRRFNVCEEIPVCLCFIVHHYSEYTISPATFDATIDAAVRSVPTTIVFLHMAIFAVYIAIFLEDTAVARTSFEVFHTPFI